jgi:hypothetical protein
MPCFRKRERVERVIGHRRFGRARLPNGRALLPGLRLFDALGANRPIIVPSRGSLAYLGEQRWYISEIGSHAASMTIP